MITKVQGDILLSKAQAIAQGVALIVGVDRLLDMCRTTLNVTGDMVATMVMDRWIGGKLSARRERAAEEKRQTRRAQTGEDVIVHNSTPPAQAT